MGALLLLPLLAAIAPPAAAGVVTGLKWKEKFGDMNVAFESLDYGPLMPLWLARACASVLNLPRPTHRCCSHGSAAGLRQQQVPMPTAQRCSASYLLVQEPCERAPIAWPCAASVLTWRCSFSQK